MADTDGLLIAATTAVITHEGRTYRIRKGDTVVMADDPVVKGREKLFKPLKVTHLGRRERPAAQVEDATAEPGEKRELSRPRTPGKPRRRTPPDDS